MSTYNGLFLRSTLGADNTIPKPGAQSGSPDIIPYGVQPVADPKTTFSNYGVDYGQQLLADVPNFIYMRSKNYADQKITSSPRLFYSQSSLLSYPSKWQEIKDNASGSGKPSISADSQQVGIIDTPFVWTPDNPGSNWHYCMIGMVQSPGCLDPDAVLSVVQVADLASVVAQNGGLAWRNISVVPTNQINVTFNQHYSQGTLGSQMQITLICTNIPTSATVSFSAGQPGTNPAFYLSPTKVSTYPSFTTGIVTNIPANWESDVYMTISAPAGTSLVNASMAIQVAYPTTSSSELYSMAFTPHELGIPHPDIARNMIMRQLYNEKQPLHFQPHHEQYLEQLVSLNAAIGPTRLIVVGENTGKWQG